ETSGGGIDIVHSVILGAVPIAPNDYSHYTQASVTRTYYEASAGTYTFYFQGTAFNDGSRANVVFSPVLTAAYYPTSYRSVTTIASGAERAAFPDARSISIPANGPIPAVSDAAVVDLRELELKVARTHAEAEKAQRQLAEARMKQELSLHARPAA